MTNEEIAKREWRWQDGKGLVHILAPIPGVDLAGRGAIVVIGWAPACGYQRKNTSRGQSALAATCLRCIAERSK